MLQVDNQSALKFSLGVFANEDGVETVYGAAKATFAIDPQGKLTFCEEQDDVVLLDEHWGEPLASSLRAASEMTLIKPATDVLMRGHAHAPKGKASQVDVTLALGSIRKTVRVFGDRVWKEGVLGIKPTDPAPFERMPLLYENAFGGTDAQPVDAAKIDFEPRNPIGRGLFPKNTKTPLAGLPLPNLEDPAQLLRSPKDRPPPAGFGPICSHWDPRKSYAGTYDEAWTQTRAPYLPVDFNPRFFQSAPPDQIVEGYLKGGEPVEILNATPEGKLAFKLPACEVSMTFRLEGRDHASSANLDTVTIDPDAGRLWMIWRSCLAVDKKLLRLETIRVVCPAYPRRKGA